MRKISILLLLAASAALGQVSEGDQHYAARAEGHVGGRAKPAQIDAAIAAYQRAIAANPRDLEARWKLLRAYRFKGAYVAAMNDEKKKVYGEAKTAGEGALALLHVPPKATEKQVADATRTIPGAGETFLWDSVNWGEWALAYGKMAAAREGAADRIRREATIAMLIDPRLEGGAPPRVLGRLHDQTPRIPFMTGWASSKEAVRFLSESLKIDPTNKITKVFLAEAMVSDDKPQAVRLLKECLSAPNPPEYEVEQAAATEDARALLKKWGF
jgi:tetratricopeptide (TPR) repeat protein